MRRPSFFHFNSMRCSGGKYKYAGRLKSEDSRKLDFGRIHQRTAFESASGHLIRY